MRANPGGEIAPQDVVGRDALIEDLWRILGRQSLELTAERRIGKSSVIKKMTAEPRSGFVAIYQDLEGVRTRLQFVESVYRHAEALLSRRQRTADRLRQLVSTLSGAQFKGVRFPRVPPPEWKRLLEAICADLQTHVDATLVFFWDEIPFMLQNILAAEGEDAAREVLDVLRAMRQTNAKLRMVFTGSIGLHHVLQVLRSGGATSHAPMNDMDRVDVPPLELADAVDLAMRIVEGEGQLMDAAAAGAAAQALARAVNGIAFYVHLVLDGLIKERLPVTVESVEDLIHRRLHDSTDPWNLAHFLHRTETYYGERRDLAVALLDAVASSDQVPRAMLINVAQTRFDIRDPHLVLEMLGRLVHDHYVVGDYDGNFRFVYSVVLRWWRHHRAIVVEDEGHAQQAGLDL